MLESIYNFFVEQGPVILAVVLAIFAYAVVQAIVDILKDAIKVKVFKKKLNGNGKNGKRDPQLEELIVLSTERNEKLDCLPTVAKQVSEMHGIVCEEDENKFPKLRVMEKKMREVWDKVIKGVD